MKKRQPIFPALMCAAGIVLSAAISVVSAPTHVHAQQGSCSKNCYDQSRQCVRRANEPGLSGADQRKIVKDCLRAEAQCVDQKCHGY